MINLIVLAGLAQAALPAWKHIATAPTTFTVSQDAQGYMLTPGEGFGCVVVDLTKPAGANTSPIACPTQTFSLQLRPANAETNTPATVQATRGDDGALRVAYTDLATLAVGPVADFAKSPVNGLFGLIQGTFEAELTIAIIEGTCGKGAGPRGCAVSYGHALFPASGFGAVLLASLRAHVEAAPAACGNSRCDELVAPPAADERWLNASGCGRQSVSEACATSAVAWRTAEVTRRTAVVTKAVDTLAADPSTALPTQVAAALAKAGTLPEDVRIALRERAMDVYAHRFDQLLAQQPALRAAAVDGAADPYAFKGDANLELMSAVVKRMADADTGDVTKVRAARLEEERKASLSAKFERAMTAQPTLRFQRAPDDDRHWYEGEANLKRIDQFLTDLDRLDTPSQQAARRGRFERENAAQQVVVDALARRREAAAEAAEARASRSSGSSSGLCHVWYYPSISACGMIFAGASECGASPSSMANSVCRNLATAGESCRCP